MFGTWSCVGATCLARIFPGGEVKMLASTDYLGKNGNPNMRISLEGSGGKC